MIILGTEEQANKYIPESLPKNVKKNIKSKLKVLDDNYGSARIYSRTGGFAVIIEKTNDFSILADTNFLDVSKDIPEIVEEISGYIIKTYIVGTEFSIVTIEKQKMANVA